MELKILIDKNPESPRSWDNLGTMVCWHRRYKLGDLQPSASPGDWIDEHMNPCTTVSLPLYLYDHSGITMNTTGFDHCDMARWDWDQVGHIFVGFDKIRKELCVKKITPNVRQRAMKLLTDEVKIYDQYLRGNVWGWVYNGAEKEDSCWGYFGDTLEETGIANAIPEEAKLLLEKAWEERR